MKKRKGYYFFLISIILLAVVTIALSYFDSQGTMLAPRSSYSQCITPPAYPQLITQSGTICPGTYNYGIGIGANNVKINCQAGTSFNGANWGGTNGVTILSVNDITLDGCEFTNFTQDGVHIEGTPSSQSSRISLLNIVSSINRKDGVYVGANVLNFSVNDSLISANLRDGLYFNASYFGNLTTNADLFPNGISIFENTIANNRENGINFNAFNYHLNLLWPLNNSVKIEKNNVSNNVKNGIQFIGFSENMPSFRGLNSNSHIYQNFINYNGENGVSMVAAKSRPIYPLRSHIGHISFNDIIGNADNGISFSVPSNDPQVYTGSTIFANYITTNGKNGVAFSADPNNYTDTLYFSFFILQNHINSNVGDGVNIDSINLNGQWWYSQIIHSGHIECNDILFNGAGQSDGIELRGSDISQSIYISDKNIIENNNRGIYFTDYGPAFLGAISYNVINNSITSNAMGLFVNHSYDSNEASYYYGNDFDQNTVQAIDRNAWAYPGFRNNWWSDYSPTCADINPADGWCDVPRFIPVGETEWQTKAGTWWGHKLRGYLVKANTGVVPKQDCPIIEFPQPFNNTLVAHSTGSVGTNNPQEPGTSGSGSSGTTGGTGEPGSSNSDG